MTHAMCVVPSSDFTSGGAGPGQSNLDIPAVMQAIALAHLARARAERRGVNVIAGQLDTATPHGSSAWGSPATDVLLDDFFDDPASGLYALSAEIRAGLAPAVSDDLRAAAARALARLRERDGEDVDEWAERLGREFGNARD